MRNEENGMEVCSYCHMDCENEDLTLVDDVEGDIDTGELVEIQVAICPDCLEKRALAEEVEREKHWNVITYCERENVFGDMMPAEWFFLNAPYATKEEAEANQAAIEANSKGTDADWPEAYAAKKIVHDDELSEYDLTPLNGGTRKKGESQRDDPCVCFADGEEWIEEAGHDWEELVDGSLRCTNCGANERGGLDRL